MGDKLRIMQTLGSYLRDQRERRGWLQTELAARSGVPQATISAIETGTKKLPGADIRRKLARALGVRHVDLLIAAGEVDAEEIEPGYQAPLFTEGDLRADIVALLPEISDENADLVLGMVQRAYERRRQILTQTAPREVSPPKLVG